MSKTLYSYLLVNDFKQSNRKECIKLDKKNEKIYMDLLEKAKKAERSIQNSILSVNLEVPPPPRPSNLERYNLWEKRNIHKPVIEQSEAIVFLQNRGYVLNDDYEAYQAIDLYKEIKKDEGIEDLPDDKTTQFDTVFTKNDNNILRRRSIHRMSKIETDSMNYENQNRRNTFPYSDENKYNKEQKIKPSAPPISHNVVYPEPSKTYYPQYFYEPNKYQQNSDFEV